MIRACATLLNLPNLLLGAGAALCLAGCPGGMPEAEDMAGPDLMKNTGDMRADPGNTLVVQLPDGQAVAGADVLVNDGAGVMVQLLKTDARGEATVTVPKGGMVSVLQTDGVDRYIDAVIDPPGGSRLRFYGYRSALNPPEPTTLELTLTDVPAGTTSLRFYHGCGSGSTLPATPTLQVRACESDGKYDFLILAQDGAGQRLAWGGLIGEPAAPGQTLKRSVPVNRTDFVRTEAEASGVPQEAGMSASLRLDPAGALRARLPYTIERVSQAQPPGGLLRAALQLPAGLSAEGVTVRAGYGRAVPETAEHVFSVGVTRSERFTSLPARVSKDLGGVPEVRIAAPDLTDARRPRYAWQPSAPARGDMGWFFASALRGAGGIYFYVEFPPEQGPAVRWPELPAALKDWAPQAGDTHDFAQVSYYDYEQVSGFAEYLDPEKRSRNTSTTYSIATVSLKGM